jgi:excisionase family DNA binding protein
MIEYTNEPKIAYTIEETSKITGLGRTRLYEELNSGRLKGVKAGRRTLILYSSIQQWLENLESYPISPKVCS